jgi:uncharacterized OB-fold protein
MYCKNCGGELIETPELCPHCGARPLAGNSFCQACGSPITPLTEICMKCGARVAKTEAVEISPKSRLTVTLFAWFLGTFGAHRFYLGKPGTAVLMLLTGGGLGIWALVDFIMAVSGTMRDKEGRLIKSWNPSEPAGTTELPKAAGILSIIAGAIGLIIGITVAALVETVGALTGFWGLGAIGAPLIVIGIISIVGGVFALQRRIWGLALAGAICALMWPVTGLGIPAIIFVALSKNEFE